MDEAGARLSTLLHEAVPEPPVRITGADIRDLDVLPSRHRDWRPITGRYPLLAAVAVVVGALAVGAVLIGSGRHHVPAIHSSPTPSISGAADCQTDQLSLTVNENHVVDGMEQTTFRLTNTGSRPCIMNGFPLVMLAIGSPPTVGTPFEPVGPAGAPVTVPRSGFGEFTISVGRGAIIGCDSPGEPESSLQVYPPNQHTSLPITFPDSGCSDSYTVTAVTAGSYVQNCDLGEVEATAPTGRISLDQCTGVIGDEYTLTVSPGQQIAVTQPQTFQPAQLLATDVKVVSLSGETITAVAPGTTTIFQSGWRCASGATTCALLKVVVQ